MTLKEFLSMLKDDVRVCVQIGYEPDCYRCLPTKVMYARDETPCNQYGDKIIKDFYMEEVFGYNCLMLEVV